MWDLSFDPVTGDLQRNTSGGWITTEAADTSVLNQLCIHFGSWFGDPQIGSLLHDLNRFAASPAELIRAEVERSLDLLVDEKTISDLTVQANDGKKAGLVTGNTTYRVVATGQLASAAIPRLR